jgi:hypothetical protein
LQSGWKLLDDGFFHKGNVSRRPSEMVPVKMPGDYDFDWTRDAFAIRLGATYVSPNRYQYGQHFMDHLGRFLDPKVCRYCGGTPYFVQVVDPWPGAQRYERGRTYCTHCVTPTMLAENERNVQGWVPPRPTSRAR